MKKTTYTLAALLVICLVGLGLLLASRLGDHRQMQTLNQRVDELTVALDGLQKEKAVWEQEKTRVAQSLGSVRGVLVKTLVDLEEVSAQIGLPLPTVAPPAPSEKPQEATAAPTDKPTPTAKPTASPAPEATKAPATEVPDKGATAAPKVSPTPGVPTVTPK